MTEKNKILQGTIKRHPDGFGFFIPQDKEHADVFIPAHAMKSSMTNDSVTVMVEKERDGRFKGEIVRITERSQKKIAGVFTIMNENFGLIKDEGKGWGKDLKIPMEKSLSAKKGELVVAKISTYPDEGDFIGEVSEIIGDAEDALNDIKRVVIAQGIPEEFSPETLNEAKKFSHNPEEKDFANRTDLRNISLITIDGATAKDFDDAVYVEMTQQGFHLIVGIADVSHYVKNKTSIDKDAYDRGTSVYFPNFVIPMLPEALSNGLCSLVPHVPRLALVADMQFSFTGEMTSSKFYEAVIESKARVTYGEAQAVIDGEKMEKFSHVKDMIFRCADLAKILMAKRFKEGSLDLEVPETELIIDGSGEPIDVVKSERLFAHRLIEEMMLAANVAVAKFLSGKEIPAIYRTHEPPDPMKIRMLEKYMQNFGSRISLGTSEKLQKKLTKALHEFKDEQSQIIHILTLRSMSQAKYTLENIGHFGLGFDFYTHFTSPIRRYPDLIVHRLIKSCIGLNQYRLMADDDIQTAGTWLSACEQRSAKAERQIQSIKKARFMKKLLGQTFDGMISSVTKFGLFVLLREYNIDGLIRLDDLGLEKWEFDEENLKLVATRSGMSHSIGDRLRVTVSSVDVEAGQINFVLEGKEAVVSNRNDKRPTGGGRNQKFNKNNLKKAGTKNNNKSNNKSRFESYSKKSNSTESHSKKPNSTESFSKKPNASDSFSKKAVPAESSNEQKPSQGYSVPKAKYASLSDYLDQMAKKSTGQKQSQDQSSYDKKKDSKFEKGFSKNRKDSEKRKSSENDSGGVRKARPEKSGRKTKSR